MAPASKGALLNIHYYDIIMTISNLMITLMDVDLWKGRTVLQYSVRMMDV